MANRPTARKGGATRRLTSKSAAGSRTSEAKSTGSQRNLLSMDFARSIRVNSYNLTIVALIVVGVATLQQGVTTWYVQQQQIADVAAQVEAAKKQVAQMQVERKRWDDPVYVRSQARDRLYYVMPGEVSYLVMDANGIDPNDTSGTVGAQMADRRNTTEITNKIRETKDNWVDSLLYTVVRSGLDQPTQ
ncbi:MAG: septum formation initiator family protein [Actinomycetales bacterium]|nr:septum formation initiator family protein [Actinomycetales bacterium]